MNQIILATHGGLADGMRDTLSMVLGDASNVHVVSLARDDKDPITSKVQALIDSFDPADKVYICTDMLGSSVNNEMVALGAANEKLTIIAGMNMPFVIELAAAVEPLTNEELVELIKASREGLRDCSANPVVVAGAATPAKKARAAASAGPAKINLVRLDYRLLHGQVVFSWVTKVGAERIIVVDNDAAGDDVKKSALRLAKYFLAGNMFSGTEVAVLGVGCLVAFLVSLAVIRFLMAFVRRHDFKPFGWYRIVLGVAVIAWFALMG